MEAVQKQIADLNGKIEACRRDIVRGQGGRSFGRCQFAEEGEGRAAGPDRAERKAAASTVSVAVALCLPACCSYDTWFAAGQSADVFSDEDLTKQLSVLTIQPGQPGQARSVAGIQCCCCAGLSPRDHPDFKHLTDLKDLEGLVGGFIKLPLLGVGRDELPKGFDDPNRFFLSRGRFDLLKRALAPQTAQAPAMILKGPHGCGKSSMAYLIASYAYVNGHMLQYLVSILTRCCHIFRACC